MLLDIWVGQLSSLDFSLGGSWVGQIGLCCDHPHQERDRASFPVLTIIALSCYYGEWSNIFQGQQIVGILQNSPQISTHIVHMAWMVNTDHRHQHRTQMRQQDRPRYGPQQQIRLRNHHGSGWQHRHLITLPLCQHPRSQLLQGHRPRRPYTIAWALTSQWPPGGNVCDSPESLAYNLPFFSYTSLHTRGMSLLLFLCHFSNILLLILMSSTNPYWPGQGMPLKIMFILLINWSNIWEG